MAGVLVAICSLICGAANAGTVPGFQKLVSLQAAEQTVPSFIESLFSQVGVPVRVESSIPGTVNGSFKGTAEEVFSQISQAFNVYLYYDTSAAYVYSSAEMQSKILPLTHSAANRVASSANRMGFVDQRNYVTPIEGGGLMVNGSARFTEQIEALSLASREQVKSIKPKVSPIEFRLFRLKYAWADDVDLNVGGRNVKVPGVATMLRTLVLDDGSLPLASGVSVRRDALRLAKLKGSGLQAEKNNVEEVAPRVSRQPSDSQFSIVAQPQLNAVAIRDTADRMPLYEQLIESLDVEPEMVEIEATIIDINVDRTRELGINWRLQGTDGEFLLGEGNANDQLLRPGSIITPQGEGGVLSLVLGDSTQFFSRVQALEREGAANIVSKPHVLTLSNVEAILGATTEFFVRVEGTEEVDLFKVPVGTVLRVTPHVYNQGANSGIKLLVNIEDGSAIPGSSVDNIPVVERSAISTQALVSEGASLLIGGMVRESNSHSESSVPLLGDLPWLGNLFKSSQTTKTKTERIFMITPRIANSNPAKFNGSGPVLQGDPMDIVTSTDRIDRAQAESVEVRADRFAAQLREGDENLGSRNKALAKLSSQEMTLQLLQVPDAPTAEEISQSRALMQWHEVGGAADSNDVVLFEEVRTSLQFNEEAQLEKKLVEESAAFTQNTPPVAIVPAISVVPNRSSIRRSVVSSRSPAVQSPIQRSSSQRSSSVKPTAQKYRGSGGTVAPVNRDAINDLADAIALDLKTSQTVSALQKISQMKKLSPTHDYAVNGESYVKQLGNTQELSPMDL